MAAVSPNELHMWLCPDNTCNVEEDTKRLMLRDEKLANGYQISNTDQSTDT